MCVIKNKIKRTENYLTYVIKEGKFVKDIETGPFRVVTEAGEKTIQTLSAVVIEHKGFDVRVGSWFSIADRELFYNNPLLIKGKTITVQYFEETKNQDGGISLRFPTYKGLQGVKRNV